MFEGARRSAVIFMLAVLAPSLLLAWLALGTLRDQETVLEMQKARVCQSDAEAIAVEIRGTVNALPEILGNYTAKLALDHGTPSAVAVRCDELLVPAWPLARVGFAVNASGDLISPAAATSNAWAASFRRSSDDFIENRVSEQAFVNKGVALYNYNARPQGDQQQASPVVDLKGVKVAGKTGQVSKKRNVEPQSKYAQTQFDNNYETTLLATEGSFASMVGDSRQGTLARFVNDRMRLLVWNRMDDPGIIFGAEINLDQLSQELAKPLRTVPQDASACFVLLDDTGKVRASCVPGFVPKDWSKPFVSVEVGEALPHWEVAGYLLDPDAIPLGVRTIQWTIGGLIGLMLILIAIGGFLIMSDVRRQVRLARQRTDFVSNVSHELKTPLTSIRMFSEMLVEDRVPDQAKQKQYLAIIGTEASRLTRLINNVLDFARIERREACYNKGPFDLREIVSSLLKTAQLAQSAELISTMEPLPVCVDPDAISQIAINLLSNAEKYASGTCLRVETIREDDKAVLRISDGGPGIPNGMEEKIFKRFFRLNDSLSSGTAGAGIGLTLSRQIARDHGGELRCLRRKTGACFELILPLIPNENENIDHRG